MKRRQALKVYKSRDRQPHERLVRAGRVLKRFYYANKWAGAAKCRRNGYVPSPIPTKLQPRGGYEFLELIRCRCGFLIRIQPGWIGAHKVSVEQSRQIARAIVNGWRLRPEERKLFEHPRNNPLRAPVELPRLMCCPSL